MPSPLHDRLVTLGARWLRRQGFGAVATELASYATREQPDVLGFRSSCSAIIEVKVSRSDFLRDRKKPHRATGGIGNYRFYLCPPDVIPVEDLPEKWGLLHYAAGKIVEIVRPRGNDWPPAPHPAYRSSFTHWAAFYHASDPQMERNALYSIARRSQVSHTRTRHTPLAKDPGSIYVGWPAEDYEARLDALKFVRSCIDPTIHRSGDISRASLLLTHIIDDALAASEQLALETS